MSSLAPPRPSFAEGSLVPVSLAHGRSSFTPSLLDLPIFVDVEPDTQASRPQPAGSSVERNDMEQSEARDRWSPLGLTLCLLSFSCFAWLTCKAMSEASQGNPLVAGLSVFPISWALSSTLASVCVRGTAKGTIGLAVLLFGVLPSAAAAVWITQTG